MNLRKAAEEKGERQRLAWTNRPTHAEDKEDRRNTISHFHDVSQRVQQGLDVGRLFVALLSTSACRSSSSCSVRGGYAASCRRLSCSFKFTFVAALCRFCWRYRFMDAPAHRAEYILRHVEEFLGRIEVIASRSLAGGNRNFANYETIIRQGIQDVGYKASAMPTPRQAHELAEEFDRVVRNARDQRWAAVQDLPLPNNLAYFETFFNLMERQISRSAEKKAVAIPDPPFRWCGAESDNGMLQFVRLMHNNVYMRVYSAVWQNARRELTNGGASTPSHLI